MRWEFRCVKARETDVNEVRGAVIRGHLTLSLKDCWSSLAEAPWQNSYPAYVGHML